MGKKGKKAAAAAAGAAGAAAGGSSGGGGGARVNLSEGAEDAVRELLAAHGGGVNAPAGGGGAARAGGKKLAKRLDAIYGELAAKGFTEAQIRAALERLADAYAGKLPTTGDALDWLCMNVPAHELPAKFARSVRASDLSNAAKGGSVAVKSKQKKLSKAEEAARAKEQKARDKAAQAEAAKAAAAAMPARAARRGGASAEDDAQAARRWILQNYDESEEEQDDVSEGELDAGIEDWLVCGDARERERRAAERREAARRAALPRDEHGELIASEYARAKEAAVAAKERGDKDAQREAGMAIRELKAEADALKLTQQELELGPRAAAKALAAAQARAEAAEAAVTGGDSDSDGSEFVLEDPLGDGDDGGLEDGADGGGDIGGSSTTGGTGGCGLEAGGGAEPEAAASGACAAAPSTAAARAADSSDEDGFDLADVWDSLPDEATPSLAPEPAVEPGLEMWGDYSRGKRSKLKSDPRLAAKAAQAKALEQQRLPKAVLQAHCQKQGLPPPRFERRDADLAFPQALRYVAHVAAPQQRRRKGASGSARPSGPVEAGLTSEDTEWLLSPQTAAGGIESLRTVQAAQNAAATVALFALLPDQPLARTLPPPYSELWSRLEARSAEEAQAAARGEFDKKQDFIDSLVGADVAAGADARADPGAGADATGDSGGRSADDETRVPSAAGQQGSLKRHVRGSGPREGQQIKRAFEALRKRRDYADMESKRRKLPIAQVRQEIIDALKEHDVVVLSGQTGSGKTTQVPQYLLEEGLLSGRGDACNVVCTQPRRIAAISVAERVAQERCDKPPGRKGSMVGYHVRLDAAATDSTRLLFCTTGILLRRLASDPDLDEVSHCMVDEVHERSLQSDFLLVLLRDVVARRRARGDPLKMVLMSATLDAGRFSGYFGGCPHVSAEGRTFPVQAHYLEDVIEMCEYSLGEDSPAAIRGRRANKNSSPALSGAISDKVRQRVVAGWGDDEIDGDALNPDYDSDDYGPEYSAVTKFSLRRMDESRIDYELIERVLEHIDESCGPGAVLVFLPGAGEISSLLDQLRATRRFGRGPSARWVLPLHSQLPPAEQKRVFDRPPEGVRKIVLGTNIMETSITIDDVVFVVDTGKVKNMQYSPARRMTALVEEFVSRAASQQRKGRAGRVQPGTFYALYTRARLERRMREFTQPEIVRVPLADTCLQIKLLNVGSCAEVLARTVEPPAAGTVAVALQTLREVGAMDDEEELTPLGHHLAALPVDVRVGKMLVFGALLRCLDPVLTIAACLSNKSPFASSMDAREASDSARRAFAAPLPASGMPPKGSAGALPGVRLSAGQESDHLSSAAAYNAYRHTKRTAGASAARQVCRRHWLSEPALGMITDLRGQFFTLLRDAGLVDSSGDHAKADDMRAPWNAHASTPEMVKAVLVAGLYPNVAAATTVEVKGGSVRRKTTYKDEKGEVAVHPSSALHAAAAEGRLRFPFVAFHEKVQTSRAWIRDVTCVSPISLLLFGGELNVLHDASEVLVDGILRVRAPAQTAVLCKELRLLLDAELRRCIEAKRGRGDAAAGAGEKVMATIAQVLADEAASK